jgi:hypothetical protein
VRRRQGEGVSRGNSVEKALFLAHPENPAQPIKSFCTAVCKGQNVTRDENITISGKEIEDECKIDQRHRDPRGDLGRNQGGSPM